MPAADRGQRITVYRRISTRVDRCELGFDHPVTVFAMKWLGPEGMPRIYDNGYGASFTPTRYDRQGRRYHAHPPTDFHGATVWVRLDDDVTFVVRPIHITAEGCAHAVDVLGRPLR